MEILCKDPIIMVDGAHNPYSVRRLSQSLLEMFEQRRIILIFGASRDKDISSMIDEVIVLAPIVIITNSRQPRAAKGDSIEGIVRRKGLVVHVAENVSDAVTMAKNLVVNDEVIVAAGSLFVAAEVREVVKGLSPELYSEFLN